MKKVAGFYEAPLEEKSSHALLSMLASGQLGCYRCGCGVGDKYDESYHVFGNYKILDGVLQIHVFCEACGAALKKMFGEFLVNSHATMRS